MTNIENSSTGNPSGSAGEDTCEWGRKRRLKPFECNGKSGFKNNDDGVVTEPNYDYEEDGVFHCNYFRFYEISPENKKMYVLKKKIVK
jgi:hypothetical protein